MIREATLRDIPDVVNIHHSTLSDDFFPNLGKRVLTTIYRDSTNSKLYVYEVNTTITGFIKVTFTKPIILSRLMNMSLYLLVLLISWEIIKNPFALYYLSEYLIYSLKKDPVKTEIVALAVLPNWQRKNIGTQLVNRIEEEITKKRIGTYKVVTRDTHIPANQFYKKMRFTWTANIRLFGKGRNIYIKNLNDAKSF